jgi:DNA-binding XRE family transcriptional regulator
MNWKLRFLYVPFVPSVVRSSHHIGAKVRTKAGRLRRNLTNISDSTCFLMFSPKVLFKVSNEVGKVALVGKKRIYVADKLPGWAIRINLLRNRLHLNQTDFGRMLHCSSMAISRFERGLQKPPADCFIALGKLAGSRSGWYFWHMAGVTVRDVRRMMAAN